MCIILLTNFVFSLGRPFWLSPRQILVIPVAAPFVRILQFLMLSNHFIWTNPYRKNTPLKLYPG